VSTHKGRFQQVVGTGSLPVPDAEGKASTLAAWSHDPVLKPLHRKRHIGVRSGLDLIDALRCR
jgi:hypothetical protein